MRLFLVTILALAAISPCLAQKTTLQSPDGKIATDFFVENGKMFYTVSLNGQMVLEKSPLGIKTATQDFSAGMTLKKTSSIIRINQDYTLKLGKKRDIKYSVNEIIYSLQNAGGQMFEVIFRASNDGVAFRYWISGIGSTDVISENSGFKLPENSTAFITPLSKAKSGWMRTNPSYEETYHLDMKVGTPSNFGQGWTYPALFKVGDGAWVLISETNVDSNYAGTCLADTPQAGLYMAAFPPQDQNLPTDPSTVAVSLSFETPWRTINVGDLATVVESTMAQDLAEPLYKAKYDYRPGKASWSWIILKDDNILFDVQKKYIDMATGLGWEYCLVDGNWDVMIGREKIAELAKYAADRNVGLILWYNSNGQWNDAPQTPRNLMDTRDARIKEMAWMRSIGIKGIKVDFFGGDKQRVIKLYDDILRDANDYGIAVNFHGTTLPRGWERMYPNFLTNEAVKGQEFITFDQNTADRQAAHCATLVFTRNVVAPMDFTPLALNARLGVKPGSGPVRRTTAGFELALPVVFFSPLQHFALVPENVSDFPSFVADYLKEVPTVWDDTRLLAGYPGKNAVLARCKNGRWFVAGINGENRSVRLSFDLSFLDSPKNAKLITDSKEWNEVSQSAVSLAKGEKFEIELQPNGGFVMIID